MNKVFRFLAIVILLFVTVYIMGPKPPLVVISKNLPSVSGSVENIEDYVKKQDAGLQLKPDNESRVIWANDSLKERTDYSLLYLHGFSASWYEGYPANVKFARHFGCNAFFPRLASPGIKNYDDLS